MKDEKATHIPSTTYRYALVSRLTEHPTLSSVSILPDCVWCTLISGDITALDLDIVSHQGTYP